MLRVFELVAPHYAARKRVARSATTAAQLKKAHGWARLLGSWAKITLSTYAWWWGTVALTAEDAEDAEDEIERPTSSCPVVTLAC